jgi:hypothetical protein
MSIAFSGLPPLVHSSTCRCQSRAVCLGSVRCASLPAASVPVGGFGCSGSSRFRCRRVFSRAPPRVRHASHRCGRSAVAVCGCVAVHVARCTLHVLRHVEYCLSSAVSGRIATQLRCIAMRRVASRRVASHCLLVEHLALRRANFSEQRVDVVPAARGAHAGLTRRSRVAHAQCRACDVERAPSAAADNARGTKPQTTCGRQHAARNEKKHGRV